MIRVQLCLDPEEVDLLDRWAQLEMRDLRGQIRFLLRQVLEHRGLLASNIQIDSTENNVDENNQHVRR